MRVLSVWTAALVLILTPDAIADDNEGVELKIELPEPYFGGTPLDYFGSNLEEPNYKPRPPFYVPPGVVNVAQGKPVTGSVPEPEYGEFGYLVDGDKSYKDASLLALDRGLQWIQIDLGTPCDLYALTLWHFHQGDRVYFDVMVRVADDSEFTTNVRTVFNNDHDNTSGLGIGTDKEYIESYKSKFIDLKGVRASSIRFYSKGNTTDDFNHYVEAEVFGKPAN